MAHGKGGKDPHEVLDRRAATPVPAMDFPVVGLGASAGGLEALELFFSHLPTDTGIAFIVVQHLSPDFKSLMDELLGRHTQLPIHRVTDGMQVEPNAVYLIPPKKEMVIVGGKLLLSDKEPGAGLTLPIDTFLRSLAQDVGSRAIAVILSGTGSDGSRGIIDIRAAGGLVLAQELTSAKFDGMPKSALETGVVDVSLCPERMPAAILAFLERPGSCDFAEFLPAEQEALEGFDAIFQLLRKAFNLDFSLYKRGTVSRRVQRRLEMLQITDLDDYVTRLRSDPGELNLLYKDLLIGVTKFFRDTDAFRHLEQDVLPEAMAKIGPDDEFRIWVVGCATGEEAYSVAILICEQLDRMESPIPVKIFATDVHRASLEFASVGLYRELSLRELSPERLNRFFTRVNDRYQVSQRLRQMIVFAPHDIIRDAPFTKIDLISCRNMLIYLEPSAQNKAIALFHFALKTGGVMLMGPSEHPGDLASDFEALNERWRIFRKCRDRRLPAETRLPLVAAMGVPSFRVVSPVVSPPDASLVRVYDELLKEFAPPSFLINHRRELLQSFGGASSLLRHRDGRPTTDICELVGPELKLPLSSALQQCAKKQAPVLLRGIRVSGSTDNVEISLSVKPIRGRQENSDLYLVTISEAVRPQPTIAEGIDVTAFSLDEATKEQYRILESELLYVRETLQATVEEMETSNEELQATNEELVASNEELQSTNEELHSVNEELYTVNAEYQKKISELSEMTTDLDNLLQNTDVGVIFLDHDLHIRKFTPKIADVFHLLPVDVGRPMDNFAHTLRYPMLMEHLKQVLRDGEPIEGEVTEEANKIYLLRIIPYRHKGRMDGLVLTLVDISRLKQAESDLLQLSKVFLDAADPIVIEDLQGRIVNLNKEAERVFGWKREDIRGQNIEILIPPQELSRARELRARCLEQGGLRNVETIKHNRHREIFPVLLSLSLLTNRHGEPVAIASSPKDITDRKRAENLARDAVQKRDQFLAMLSHELRNPLGAALNATYLLECNGDAPSTDAHRQACRVIQRQVLQVARLLDDLLDVARVTQGRIEMRRQVLDMTQLIDDAIQAVRPLIDARGHYVTLDIAPSPIRVDGDSARLLQVIENLLANAAKYTPNGGQLHLTLYRDGGEAVLRVRDNGKGIPTNMLGSIFELFVQSDKTLDRAQGGMGLGLTLCKRIVELHGGRIAVQSPGLDLGSEFIVRLPLIESGCESDELNYGGKEQSSFQSRRRIVLVEDNDDSREMLATLLKLDGHQVSVAADGQQGLELIIHQRPDVAIVDIGLPRISGHDVARQVRQQLGTDVKLIALTGYGRPEDQEEVRQAGFDLHMVKPLKPAELKKALD